MAETHVRGLAELQKFLDQVPAKVEQNILRGALRAGMKVVQPSAKARVHSVSGLLAAGLKIGTKSRGGRVTASLKATGKHAYLAKWVEYGTRAHNIAAKGGGWLSFGGIFAKSVQHPGARAKPFMRPALDSEAGRAVVAVGEYIKARLAKKQGLNTAHIRVEGDE